jgi:hypothetical protein
MRLPRGVHQGLALDNKVVDEVGDDQQLKSFAAKKHKIQNFESVKDVPGLIE